MPSIRQPSRCGFLSLGDREKPPTVRTEGLACTGAGQMTRFEDGRA